MKFASDIIFETFPYLYCPDFQEGHQYFQSWKEFIELFTRYMKGNSKPLYCIGAHAGDNNVLYVDVSQYVEIPWKELEKYI